MSSLTLYEKNELLHLGYSLDEINMLSGPLEYITGRAQFCGLEFAVNRDVLIPRIETEKLVDLAYQEGKDIWENHLKKSGQPIHVLDMATGSGCIGIALAKRLLDQQIPVDLTLSDISPKALKVAQQNTQSILNSYFIIHNFDPIFTPYSILPDLQSSIFNFQLIQSDLFSSLPPNKKYHIITANLPYIPTGRLKKLDDRVKKEPTLALDGGPEGLKYIQPLITILPTYLISRSPVLPFSGSSFLEVDDSHNPNQVELPVGMQIKTAPDQFGHERFWIVSRHPELVSGS